MLETNANAGDQADERDPVGGAEERAHGRAGDAGEFEDEHEAGGRFLQTSNFSRTFVTDLTAYTL